MLALNIAIAVVVAAAALGLLELARHIRGDR